MFVTVDLHHIREARFVDRSQDFDADETFWRLSRAVRELQAVRAADATVLVSAFETEYLQVVGVGGNLWTIPLGREVAATVTRPDPGNPRLLFVGSLNHRPNLDGLMEFLRSAWPQVIAAFPGAFLDVVGEGWDLLDRGDLRNVNFHGWVDNLTPLYRSAWASIAPLRAGAGLKGKVIASLANGVPVLGSATAFEGLPKLDQRGPLIPCDNGFDYVRALNYFSSADRLYESRREALRVGEGLFSVGRFRTDLRALCGALGLNKSYET